MRKLFPFLIVLFITAPAFAQAAKPTDKFSWTQDSGGTAADVAAYRYELELDGKVLPAPLAPVTCSGTASPWTCEAPIPAITPSSHTARLRAIDVSVTDPINWVFSDWSDPLVFTMRATPSKPANVKIKPATP